MGAAGAVLNLGNEHELRNFRKLMDHQKLDIQNGVLYQGMLYAEKSLDGFKKKPLYKKEIAKNEQSSPKKRKKNRQRNRKNKGKPISHRNK